MSRLPYPGPMLLVAIAIMASGCGASDSSSQSRGSTPTRAETTVTSTVTAEPTKPAPASPSQPTPPVTPDASSTVRSYFAAINARDFRRAWDLGGRNLSGSYADFVNGFADTAHNTVHILRTDGDTVSVRLEATQSDGSLHVYQGTYVARRGQIVSADILEVTTPSSEPSPYYKNCDAARVAGAAPLFRHDPGYGPHLDRDGDGVACEP